MVKRALILAVLCAWPMLAAAQASPEELTARVLAAIDQENLSALQAAFAAGASPNAPNGHGLFPVVAAAMQGNRRICQAVVDAGANIDVQTDGSMGALSWAVFNRQKDCLVVFLNRKPDLEIKDGSGRTPLFVAVSNNDIAMMKLLVSAGANLQATDRTGFTLLSEATQSNHYETVEYLRSAGAKFASDSEELFAAAASGDAIHLREMLEAHRGNPNLRTIYGGNALSLAAQKGNTVIVRLLIGHGAELDVPDNNQQTALYYAIVSKHASTVEALLDAGANPLVKTPGDRSLLVTLAGWLEDAALTRRFLDAGVDINGADSYGATPLIAAAQTHKRANVQALLEAGADVSLRDKKGKTALDYARGGSDAGLVRSLSAHH